MTATQKFIEEVEANLSAHSYSNARTKLAKAVKALEIMGKALDFACQVVPDEFEGPLLKAAAEIEELLK